MKLFQMSLSVLPCKVANDSSDLSQAYLCLPQRCPNFNRLETPSGNEHQNLIGLAVGAKLWPVAADMS